MSKAIKLAGYIERKRKTGSIAVDLGDGAENVVIPPIELWPDEAFDTATAGDTKGAAAMLLGQDGADRFYAAGGNWRMLSGLVRDQQGLDVGEFEASSES
jgi:hypothetical protein